MKKKIVISILIFCLFISGCVSNQNSERGTLQFSSSPSGAQVYLDNEYRGTTPNTLTNVELGNHTLEFRYQGYQSWSTDIMVVSGTSTYYASLSPIPQQNVQPTQRTTNPPLQIPLPRVTIQESRDSIVIGNTISFSGTCTGSNSVILMLYGPGYYANGVTVAQPKVNSDNWWNYTWNPGYSIQNGLYTMIVYDAQKSSSGRIDFTVTGGGEVTIIVNKNSIGIGDSVTFSGLCTTGDSSVTLMLYGPGQYSTGRDLGSQSINADQTWTYKYQFDNTVQAGTYTVTVHDAKNTKSASISFTIGGSP
jgi:hypothetical protein